MRVDLSFQPGWREAVVGGTKTTTVRTKRHGGPGDTFVVGGVELKLVGVEAMPLSRARDTVWREEGMSSPAEFEATWQANHPTRGFRGADSVWVHRFGRI